MEGGCYGCGDDNPISLGLTFERVGERCVATFRPRAELRGVPGFLHGGVAATVLDETMASLGWMLDGVHTVTATLELKYRRPVPLGLAEPLRVESWRNDPAPKRRHRVLGRLLLSDGSVAVEASGIFVSVPAGTMAWKP